MRINVLLLSIMVFVAPIAAAQSEHREQLLKQIASSYSNINAISADSPVIDHLLESARSANPRANEQQWKGVKTEVSSTFKLLMQDLLGAALRTALAEFAVSDLSRLAAILEDPIYTRFQSTMSNPNVQTQVLDAQAKLGLQITAVINTVLANHGMKEIR